MKFLREDKKLFIGALIAIVVLFVGNIVYSCTYVGDRTVLYPKEKYSLTEKLANMICGYEDPYTIQELKDKGYIKQDTYIISINKTKVEWYKSQESLDNISIIKDGFDKIDQEKEIEKENLLMEEYLNMRNKYLNEESDTLKENWLSMIQIYWDNYDFLKTWEQSQTDNLFN